MICMICMCVICVYIYIYGAGYSYNFIICETVVPTPLMLSWGIPNSWMVYFVEKPKIKWMIKRGVPSGKLAVNGIINGIINNGIWKVTVIVN